MRTAGKKIVFLYIHFINNRLSIETDVHEVHRQITTKNIYYLITTSPWL